MNKNEIINDILLDWSYKVPNGVPDINNYEHRMIFKEILNDYKLPEETIQEIMNNLYGTTSGLLVEMGSVLDSITTSGFYGRGKSHVTSSGHMAYIDPYQNQHQLPVQDSEEDVEELEDDNQETTTLETYIPNPEYQRIEKTGNRISIDKIDSTQRFTCLMTNENYYKTFNGTLVKENDFLLKIEEIKSDYKLNKGDGDGYE